MTNDNAYGLGYEDGYINRGYACPYDEGSSLAESYAQGYGNGRETAMDI